MAKIYSLPEEFLNKLPVFNFKEPMSKLMKKEEAFLNELKDYLIKRNHTQQDVGEIIDFPVADGKALYMVAATSPVQLIHLPLGDAWHFEYAHKMTKKDIAQKLKFKKDLEKLFSKK